MSFGSSLLRSKKLVGTDEFRPGRNLQGNGPVPLRRVPGGLAEEQVDILFVKFLRLACRVDLLTVWGGNQLRSLHIHQVVFGHPITQGVEDPRADHGCARGQLQVIDGVETEQVKRIPRVGNQ